MGETVVLSANLGNFDDNTAVITDQEYPPRFNSMTPRLQARIVKMFMWQFKPGFDNYLWIDSSCRLNDRQWFIDQLGDFDIAVFRHNKRQTVQEEADFLKERMALEQAGRKQAYVLPRYENEDIDGQLAEVDPTAQLFASTAFIYRDSPQVRAAMKEWWYHTSRYHSIDQLSLPWAIKDLKVKVIDEDYLNVPAITYIRNQKQFEKR